MAKFYLKYSPAKSGLTGVEYIAPFIDEHFTNVTYQNVVSDGVLHYGILEGTGDLITRAFLALDNKFSVMKLTESEFTGACFLYYDETAVPGVPTPMPFIGFMFEIGISVTDESILEGVKSFKKVLFKEITKKRFPPNNDSLADLAKCVTLFIHHYGDLTPEQIAGLDAQTTILKQIYDVDSCIAAYTTLVSNLQSIAIEYYSAKSQVDTAETVEDIQAIVYPS